MKINCGNERNHNPHDNCPGRGTILNRCRCGAVAAITTENGQVIGLEHDCTRPPAIKEQVERDRDLLRRIEHGPGRPS